MTDIDPLARVAELGLELPPAPRPAATYVPVATAGRTLYISGQIATGPSGALTVTGKLGAELDVEAGQECARTCALNLLAQIQEALGDLTRVEQVLKLHVYVAATPDFDAHHLVANGASDLLHAVLGDAGVGARSAFGVSNLPMNSPVEVDAIVLVRE
jgi:enamine deaminase RidA (YjgF/YER057c/UK114 family)